MKKYFLTGLVTLLPLAITAWVIVMLIRLLTQPFVGIVSDLLKKIPKTSWIHSEEFIFIGSEIAILLALFLITWLLGYLARKFFIRSLLKVGDKILCHIPLIRSVYKTSKEIIQALFATKGQSLKQTVLIPFPYPGCYCIGLVASDAPKTCDEATQSDMLSVFIPTTPNPTSGFLTMVPKSEAIFLKMKSDEAIKYIVSCGVIQPKQEESS